MFNTTARSLLASSLRAKPARNPFNSLITRTIITVKEIKYSVQATASGRGRNGFVKSNGTSLDLGLPKELGGDGKKGYNPEQLFAMGYASCFLGAIQAMAKRQGKEDMGKKAVVHTSVHIGTPENLEGFGLAVDIKVEGVDEELLKAGHEFCPYSRALSKGALVNISNVPKA